MSEARIQELINIEWGLFDKVQNPGGRASCQDDLQTFTIMRSSQFRAWPEELQESYLKDLKAALAEDRNPLGEKYGYMMERTSPEEFEAVKDALPVPSTEKKWLAEWICTAHVAWQEELAAQYPHLAGNARNIRKETDCLTATSFETYLLGELLTYSVDTLRLYAAYTEKLQKEGRNLNIEVLKNTTDQYGYASIQAAEDRLSGKR